MTREVLAFDDAEIGIDPDLWPAKILRALIRRHYEKHELRLLAQLLAPADGVIELGCAIGVVALAAARIVAPERIVCFDASPDMVAEASANFERNGKPITVRHAVPVAGPGAPPERTFYTSPYFLASSLSPETPNARPVQVPTIDLGAAIAECRANVLVIDIEGGEFDLLSEVNLSAIDKILLELHVVQAGVGPCMRLISDLARQGLELDTGRCAHNVFIFRRGVAGSLPEAKRHAFAEAYLQALEHSEAGDRDGAAKALLRAIEANPWNAHARLLQAQLFTLDGPEISLASARDAVRLDPHNEDAFEQLGVVCSLTQDLEEAARAYDRAISIAPHRPLFHAGLGTVHAAASRAEKALAAFRAAAGLVPRRAAGLDHLRSLAVRADKSRAAGAPQPAAVDPRAFMGALAALVRDRFRFPDAADAPHWAMRMAPEDEALHHALAVLVATPRDIRDALMAPGVATAD